MTLKEAKASPELREAIRKAIQYQAMRWDEETRIESLLTGDLGDLNTEEDLKSAATFLDRDTYKVEDEEIDDLIERWTEEFQRQCAYRPIIR
jgi:hypothetical protein